MAAVNPLEQFRKSHDAKRKQELAQTQRALEAYYQDFNRYPYACPGGKISTSTNCNDADDVIDWGDSWSPYIDVLPRETAAGRNYAYWVDDSGQSYGLYAALERGGKDTQACNTNGTHCTNAEAHSLSCGGTGIYCNYGALPFGVRQ